MVKNQSKCLHITQILIKYKYAMRIYKRIHGWVKKANTNDQHPNTGIILNCVR